MVETHKLSAPTGEPLGALLPPVAVPTLDAEVYVVEFLAREPADTRMSVLTALTSVEARSAREEEYRSWLLTCAASTSTNPTIPRALPLLAVAHLATLPPPLERVAPGYYLWLPQHARLLGPCDSAVEALAIAGDTRLDAASVRLAWYGQAITCRRVVDPATQETARLVVTPREGLPALLAGEPTHAPTRKPEEGSGTKHPAPHGG